MIGNVGICNHNHISLYPYIERKREEKNKCCCLLPKTKILMFEKTALPPASASFGWVTQRLPNSLNSLEPKPFENVDSWHPTSHQSSWFPSLKMGGGSHRLSQEMIFVVTQHVQKSLHPWMSAFQVGWEPYEKKTVRFVFIPPVFT